MTITTHNNPNCLYCEDPDEEIDSLKGLIYDMDPYMNSVMIRLEAISHIIHNPKTEDEKNLSEHYHSLEIDDALKKLSKFHSLCNKL